MGAAAACALSQAGHEVFGTIRPGGSVRHVGPSQQLIEVDLGDSDAVSRALARVRPETVIHSAWGGVVGHKRTDPGQIADNINYAANLLKAAAAAGVQKFIGIGSQAEYGPLWGPVREDHLPEPTSLYGIAKLAVLHLTRLLSARAGISFAWLRLFATYGPNDNPHWLIPSLVSQMTEGLRPRTTAGDQRCDYLYISDVATAILAVAVTEDAIGLFNLGSGRAITVRQIVEKVRDRVAPQLELVFGEIPYPSDQVWHLEADVSRLREITGWSPVVDPDEGLDRTVAWCRQQRCSRARV